VQVVRPVDIGVMSQRDEPVCERDRGLVPVEHLERLDQVAATALEAKLKELLAVRADGHVRIQPHRPRPGEGRAPADDQWCLSAREPGR
jgi:hypothetical protein